MQPVTILIIGKIKNSSLKKEIEELCKRIARIKIIELKEIKENSPSQVKKKEEELILKHIKSTSKTFLIHEHGKTYGTKEFATKISSIEEQITFIVTGAFGPSEYLMSTFERISLSPMTFTHEQALYLLIEQLYRVECFEKNIPYTK